MITPLKFYAFHRLKHAKDLRHGLPPGGRKTCPRRKKTKRRDKENHSPLPLSFCLRDYPFGGTAVRSQEIGRAKVLFA
jgi:hypothetical protein